jgi:hypothetical protein
MLTTIKSIIAKIRTQIKAKRNQTLLSKLDIEKDNIENQHQRFKHAVSAYMLSRTSTNKLEIYQTVLNTAEELENSCKSAARQINKIAKSNLELSTGEKIHCKAIADLAHNATHEMSMALRSIQSKEALHPDVNFLSAQDLAQQILDSNAVSDAVAEELTWEHERQTPALEQIKWDYKSDFVAHVEKGKKSHEPHKLLSLLSSVVSTPINYFESQRSNDRQCAVEELLA